MKNWQGGLVAMLLAGTAFGGGIRVAAPVHLIGHPAVPTSGPQPSVPSPAGITVPPAAALGAKVQNNCSTAYDFLRGCREALDHPLVPAPGPRPAAAASTPPAAVPPPVRIVARPVDTLGDKFHGDIPRSLRDHQFGFLPGRREARDASSFPIIGRPQPAGAALGRLAATPSPIRTGAAALQARGDKVQRNCSNEIGLFCSGKAAGDTSRCLRDHRDDVLPGCREALDNRSAPTPASQPAGAAPTPQAPAPSPSPSPDRSSAPSSADVNGDSQDRSANNGQEQNAGAPESEAVRMNFEGVDAAAAPVPAESYLKQHGIEVQGLPSNGDLYIVDYHSIYPDQLPVRPSSPPNVLYPLFKPSSPAQGGYIVWSYTLKFQQTYSCVRFTRPGLIAGTGITYPQWSAHALDKKGSEVAVAGESLLSSSTDVPAATFELKGKDIASVHFSSDNQNFAAFGSVHVDDLELLASCDK